MGEVVAGEARGRRVARMRRVRAGRRTILGGMIIFITKLNQIYAMISS